MSGVVKQRPVLVETTVTYLLWVDDHDDEGAAALAERLNRDSTLLSERVRGQAPLDGGIAASAVQDWQWSDVYEPLWGVTQHGPWRLCPWPDCTVEEYPGYGGDPACYRHSVVGCLRRDLPERESVVSAR